MRERILDKIKIYSKKTIAILLLIVILLMFPMQSIATTKIVTAEKENFQSANESKGTYKKPNIEEYLQNNYFYDGVPEGEITIRKITLDWIVDFLAQIMDYFLGLQTLVVRLAMLRLGYSC